MTTLYKIYSSVLWGGLNELFGGNENSESYRQPLLLQWRACQYPNCVSTKI